MTKIDYKHDGLITIDPNKTFFENLISILSESKVQLDNDNSINKSYQLIDYIAKNIKDIDVEMDIKNINQEKVVQAIKDDEYIKNIIVDNPETRILASISAVRTILYRYRMLFNSRVVKKSWKIFENKCGSLILEAEYD